VTSGSGASSVLRADSGVPVGLLNPGLLDGATHGIPHDALHGWDERIDAEKVAYPAWIPELKLYGPTPSEGTLRCEVRPDGFVGSPDFPAFQVQLIGPSGVWASFRLVEACFPKGSLGSVGPADRRAFLRDRAFVPGLSLSRSVEGTTRLSQDEVDGSNWLPGTVQGIYGTEDVQAIATREHIAAAHGLHPGTLPGALPLTRFELELTEQDGDVVVRGDARGRLDISPVREFWTEWFDRDPWPVEDLYYGLIERFVGRIVFEDPQAFQAIQGRSAMYLGNHQTGVESLLFSIVLSALSRVPTVTLAKIEHKATWLGQLIDLCFRYPGVKDPRVIAFFDREDKASLVGIIAELAAEMAGPGRSVMVHVEGTRAMTCRKPVEKMSGAFIDMAMQVNAPVVPIRFVGGLPADPMPRRIEFPLGMGTQDIHIGRPLLPEQLTQMHYGERKKTVISAINGLGPSNVDEAPFTPDPAFAAEVEAWMKRTGAAHEHATLGCILAASKAPGEAIRRLLAATDASSLSESGTPEDLWLAELAGRILGQDPVG
jgi:1-acyl-sn-glycerol-3-phosphate acyltransferase